MNLPVLRHIRYLSEYENKENKNINNKSLYIGTYVSDINYEKEFSLPIGFKFILFQEYYNENKKICFECKKLIVKGEFGKEYIEEYKTYYEKYKEIILIFIGSFLSILTTCLLNYFEIIQ